MKALWKGAATGYGVRLIERKMLNVGSSEILLLLLLLLVVVGPERLPRMLRQAGQWYRRTRSTIDELRTAFLSGLDREDPERDPETWAPPRHFQPPNREPSPTRDPVTPLPPAVEEAQLPSHTRSAEELQHPSPALSAEEAQRASPLLEGEGAAPSPPLLERSSTRERTATVESPPLSPPPLAPPQPGPEPLQGRPPIPDRHEVDATRMPLMEHLRELRKRLIRSILAVFAAMAATTGFAPTLWKWLVEPMNQALQAQGHGAITVTTPMEGIIVYLRLGVITGLILAAPYLFYQAWMFVAPGLYHRERRWVVPLVMASTLLFLGGASFGYFVVFRYAFAFFLSVTEGTAETLVSMQSYLDTASRLLLAFGASFQLPILVWFFARIGLVNAGDLIRWYKYAVVAIFVVAAVLTPPDVLSQILMSIPLMLLYGISIGVAKLVSTKGKPKNKAL